MRGSPGLEEVTDRLDFFGVFNSFITFGSQGFRLFRLWPPQPVLARHIFGTHL